MAETGIGIERDPDGVTWRAYEGEQEFGSATAWVRPDGRCSMSVRTPNERAIRALVEAITGTHRRELLVNVGEEHHALRATYMSMGFVEKRVEVLLSIPVADAADVLRGADLPDGVICLSGADADEALLRELDDRLRNDVPGTEGWRWGAEDFHEETYGPHFDPALYSVAADRDTGDYVGLARVWSSEMRPPRLGMIGVVPAYRRRRIARALIGGIVATLEARSASVLTTEVDVENQASMGLVRSIGAIATGRFVELSRR